MTDVVEKTELEQLKERATLMGIKFHPNSKEDSLRSKIQAVLDGGSAEEESDEEQEEEDTSNDDDANDPADNGTAANSSMPNLNTPPVPQPKAAPAAKFVPETKEQKAYRLRLAGTKLVRVIVHCNNPMKKDWQGEQFTVSNRNLGTLNRFVPFEVEWHVEAAILEMMKDRQYLGFNARKVGPMKLEVKEPKFVKEFNIEILEPLTQKELAKLVVKQALQGGDTDAAANQV